MPFGAGNKLALIDCLVKGHEWGMGKNDCVGKEKILYLNDLNFKKRLCEFPFSY